MLPCIFCFVLSERGAFRWGVSVVEIKHALVLLLLFELYSPAIFLYVE